MKKINIYTSKPLQSKNFFLHEILYYILFLRNTKNKIIRDIWFSQCNVIQHKKIDYFEIISEFVLVQNNIFI